MLNICNISYIYLLQTHKDNQITMTTKAVTLAKKEIASVYAEQDRTRVKTFSTYNKGM